MRVLSEHESPVTAVHFSPEGRWLLSAEERGRMLLRGAVDLTVEREIWPGWQQGAVPKQATGRPVSDVLVTRDGRYLIGVFRPNSRANGRWTIHRWELDKPEQVSEELRAGLGERPALAQSHDGSAIIGFHDTGSRYELNTRERLRWELPDWTLTRQDGWGETMGPAHAATLNDGAVGAGSNSGDAILFRPKLKFGTSWRAHPTSVRGVAASVEHNCVFTAGPGQVRMWDLDTFEKTANGYSRIWGTFPPTREWARSGSQYITCLALSPDGRTIAVGRNNGTVNLLDAKSLEERVSFRWSIGNVTCLAFASDGLRIAAGGEKGSVVVWDLE